MPTSLLNEHREILSAVNKLLALVRREPRPAMDEVSALRAHIGSLLLRHMHNEEALIIGPLLASGRLDDLPGGAAVLAEVRELRTVYSRHVGQWTPQAISADWSGYVAAAIHVAAHMQAMFAREERHLHLPARQLLAPTASPRPGAQVGPGAG
ncbi:MAG TPA: hypothetical protein VNS79_06580 [Sphingobium sp.]|nr:hypothetical protein [Sphingobium sp.]